MLKLTLHKFEYWLMHCHIFKSEVFWQINLVFYLIKVKKGSKIMSPDGWAAKRWLLLSVLVYGVKKKSSIVFIWQQMFLI